MAETRIGGRAHVPAVHTQALAGRARHADRCQLQLGFGRPGIGSSANNKHICTVHA